VQIGVCTCKSIDCETAPLCSLCTLTPIPFLPFSFPGLQDAIDKLVAAVPHGRAFARPSGTEDAVRVYAEAETKAAADQLAIDVARAVYDMAGGVGQRP
jgi:phosphomannomutase